MQNEIINFLQIYGYQIVETMLAVVFFLIAPFGAVVASVLLVYGFVAICIHRYYRRKEVKRDMEFPNYIALPASHHWG